MLTSWLQPFLNQPALCSCLRGFPHCCSGHQVRCWLSAAPCDPLEGSALSSTHTRFFRVNSTVPSACSSSLSCRDCQNTLFCKQNTTELITVFSKLDKPVWIVWFVFDLCNSIKRGNCCRLGKFWASIKVSLYASTWFSHLPSNGKGCRGQQMHSGCPASGKNTKPAENNFLNCCFWVSRGGWCRNAFC